MAGRPPRHRNGAAAATSRRWLARAPAPGDRPAVPAATEEAVRELQLQEIGYQAAVAALREVVPRSLRGFLA